MSLGFRLTAAAVACVTGIAAILLTLWPGWISALREGEAVLPWQAGPWSLMLVDPNGRAMLAAQQPYLLWAVTFLLAITLFATATGLSAPLGNNKPSTGPAVSSAKSTQATELEFAGEMVTVVSLLRAHLQANGLYEKALAKAQTELPAVANADEIRTIVSYLMVENENMRERTRDLQNNLEQARRQVENLKGNLAVAKAEVMLDGLTNLKNRRGFDFALATEIAESRTSSRPLSLVLVDIDRFKSVNDSLGHPAGDEVLKWFAKLLSSNMKGRDTVARFGGEEFAIILPHTRLDNAVALAGQLRQTIEQTRWQMGGSANIGLTLTASFGVAELKDGENSASLIKRTDAKLYEAKSAGRNRVLS